MMNRKIIAIIAICIALSFFLVVYFFQTNDTRGYAVIVEPTEPYPDEYLPISEMDLLGMPQLLYAMNQTGIQRNLTKSEWQKIYDFLEEEQGVFEFHNDFFLVTLLRI